MGFHLRRAATVLRNDFTSAVEGTGLRQVLLGILSVISANPGMNQGAVGKALGIQRANMVTLVNELLAQGLVSREVAEEDRRAFSLELTEKGRAVAADMFARIAAREAALLDRLSKTERATLIALLRRIAD